MTASIIQSPAAAISLQIGALSPQYICRDEEQICQFLTAHPSAMELLRDTPAHIERLFGANTPIRLEVCFDPEYPQRQELWAFILKDMGTPEKVGEAEHNLRRLHDEWLIQLPRALSGSVYFDVEFR